MKRKLLSIFNSVSKPIRIISILLTVLFIVYAAYLFLKGGWQEIFNNLLQRMVAIVLSFFGIYGGINLFLKHNYISVKPTSVPTIAFVDRTNELKKLLSLISEEQNINIIGQSGIGKTYLVKQLVSIFNSENTLDKKYKNLNPDADILAFYICNESNATLEELVIKEINNSVDSRNIYNINDAKKLFNKIRKKHIILTFDGIKKDAEQRNEIELLFKKLYTDKIRFIIISEEPLLTTQVSATSFDIGGNLFTTVEIKEMIEKIYSNEMDTDVELIFQKSSGLPVLIDLFVRNSQLDGNYHFSRLLESLWKSDLQYELFRDIIVHCIFNNTVNGEKLSFKKSDIEALCDRHFISYDFEFNQVKIHKLVEHSFHHVFDKRDKEVYQKLHCKAFKTYKEINIERALTHLLCADIETINNEKEFIINTYEALFIRDSYDTMLNCFQAFNSRFNKLNINKMITTYVTYGNLYSLMGIGSYTDADSFFRELTVDDGPLQVNQAINEMDYRFLFKKADLSHLVNHFTIALEDLELLAISLKSSNLPQKIKEKYNLEYQLLIAHIYGHMGENLHTVITIYSDLLKQVEKFYNQKPSEYATIYIKTIYGLICSHMAVNSDTSVFSYEEYFEIINDAISLAPSELTHLHYRVNRHYSMYLRQKQNFIKSNEVLNESIEYFKKHNHRIIYDFYFSLADLYREREEFEDAIYNYEEAEEYAKNIADTNLFIYCRLGIILSLLQNGADGIEYVEELKNLLIKSREANMYIHALHIQMVLYALTNQQETQSFLINELVDRGLNFEKNLIEKNWSIKNLNKLRLIVR
ncbi:hypothetical protein LUX36_002252 [Listeria monocytogenes]|nr:hypothetical protein [Listeria monocytogenes]